MDKATILIQPKKKFEFIDFGEVWSYRELLFAFVKRDITTKYRQTIIGGGWAVIQPLFTMVVFSFFFGKLANMPSDGAPYPIFSYAGLLLWTYFSNSLGSASNSMVGAGGLITKAYFPRIIVPISASIQGVADYGVASVILLGLMLFYHTPITWQLLGLPIIVFFTWLLSSGLGLVLASVNVKYRDVRFVVPFFIQLLLYITPVIYPASVAERFRFILAINPMTGYTETHRALILSKPIPWDSLGLSILLTLFIFCFGVLYFRNMEKKFADII